jgi:hypothetical protein
VTGAERVNVWIPSSSIQRELFVSEWKAKRNSDPIAREEILTLTPQVFVMFDDRHEAFARKYGALSYHTIRQALQEQGGWAAIAGKPEWGRFTFAFNHPPEHANGLANLLLAAANYHRRDGGLSVSDASGAQFQEWLRGLEPAFDVPGSHEQAMREMVLKGPSKYDGIATFESTAIKHVEQFRGRWEGVRISYPAINVWNEGPYYVLDNSWTTPMQKQLANQFLDFLLTDPIQKELPRHGFRPADVEIPIHYPGSPFEKYASAGVRTEVPVTIDIPAEPVLRALLESSGASAAAVATR